MNWEPILVFLLIVSTLGAGLAFGALLTLAEIEKAFRPKDNDK